MHILQTHNFGKMYGSGATGVEALKPTGLTVKAGQFIAVVGPSGSGKSTLLHLLGGLDRPTSGQVMIDGKDLYAMSGTERAVFRRRKIGFVFQFYNLVPVLTAYENISLPVLLDHQKVDPSYLDEIIKLLGLGDRLNHFPGELSGGQQQRVSIARALIYKPAIVLADEPTGNLDRKNSKEVMDLLRLTVKRYRQTLMVITHDLEIASQADRVLVIEDGSIVRDSEGGLE